MLMTYHLALRTLARDGEFIALARIRRMPALPYSDADNGNRMGATSRHRGARSDDLIDRHCFTIGRTHRRLLEVARPGAPNAMHL